MTVTRSANFPLLTRGVFTRPTCESGNGKTGKNLRGTTAVNFGAYLLDKIGGREAVGKGRLRDRNLPRPPRPEPCPSALHRPQGCCPKGSGAVPPRAGRPKSLECGLPVATDRKLALRRSAALRPRYLDASSGTASGIKPTYYRVTT